MPSTTSRSARCGWRRFRPRCRWDYFFTAKELDQETGFYDFGARYLDPRLSKWMTADPALGKYLPDAGKAVAYQSPSLANNWRGHPDLPGLGGMFSPSNLALYGYGHRQPVTLVDPDGFAPKAPKILASLFGRAGQDAYNLARVTTRLRNAKLAGKVHPITGASVARIERTRNPGLPRDGQPPAPGSHGHAADRLHLPQFQLHLRQGRQCHVAAEHRAAAGHELHRRAGDQDLRLRRPLPADVLGRDAHHRVGGDV